jgi:hypothetical protein
MQRPLILALVVCAVAGVACLGGPDDPNGESYDPLQTNDAGQPICDAPKVLVCHIPPGNPANEHTICIGQPAVQAHVHHHGDKIGQACGNVGGTGGGAGGAGGAGGGAGGSGGSGGSGGNPDACVGVPNGGACTTDADCCVGGACSQGTCIPLIL